MSRCFLAALILASAVVQAVAETPNPIDEAQSLMQQKQATAAYQLLAPLESQYAGDAQFDYLLGIAAIDTGHYTNAVFALERVVSNQPDNLPARLELARAYYLLGENVTAKREFESVQAASPPKEAQATIDLYLKSIDDGHNVRNGGFNAYIQSSIGWDNNINSATNDKMLAVPLFGDFTFTLNDESRAQAAGFHTVEAGISGRHFLSDHLAVHSGASLNQRTYPRGTQYDQLTADGVLGLTWDENRWQAGLTFSSQAYRVDDENYRYTNGLTAQWTYNLSAMAQLSLYGQYMRLTYPNVNSMNTDRHILGTSYVQTLAQNGNDYMYAGAYIGDETPKNGSSSNLGNRLGGLRAGIHRPLVNHWAWFANAGLEWRNYDNMDPLFLKARRDTQFDLRTGIAYSIQPELTLTPLLGYTFNHSNIALNEYKRFWAELQLRYDFD